MSRSSAQQVEFEWNGLTLTIRLKRTAGAAAISDAELLLLTQAAIAYFVANDEAVSGDELPRVQCTDD